MSGSLTFGVRHDAGGLARDLSSCPPRLDSAMRDATRGSTEHLKAGLVRLVTRRTTMGAEVASRITESDFRPLPGGGRGTVGFKPPPPGGWAIRPKNGKALAFKWPGAPAAVGPPGKNGKYAFRGVQHPGSRPYKLVRESAVADEGAIKDGYTEEVGKVLG